MFTEIYAKITNQNFYSFIKYIFLYITNENKTNMYDYIKGILVNLTPAEAVIENNGIGYKMQISLNTYSRLQGQKECQLFIYQVIREDAHQFFGFYDNDEREIFLLLISVSGIGPNTARMMLSSMTAEETRTAIISNDVNRIKSVKGIGVKTAQKVIIELRDKVAKGIEKSEVALAELAGNSELREEAIGALIMLGFVKSAASKVVNQLIKENPKYTIEEIIKLALKRL